MRIYCLALGWTPDKGLLLNVPVDKSYGTFYLHSMTQEITNRGKYMKI